MATNLMRENGEKLIHSEEEEDDIEEQNWEDWNANEEEDDELEPAMVCLFCDSKFNSSDSLFEHCRLTHRFDFRGIRKKLGLKFYGCFKLINYVRSQVAENRCWACGLSCPSNGDLHEHLHEIVNFEESTHPWADDKYLNCFLEEDRLLYSFSDDDEGEEEYAVVADNDEFLRNLGTFENINIDDEKFIESECNTSLEDGLNASATHLNTEVPLEKVLVGSCNSSNGSSYFRSPKDKHLKKISTKISEDEIKNVNKNYFDSYSSYGIHREMISDKVRTDAYHKALLENPSLLRGAVVLDVGCGTGILSLFAARAGASKVIAVEGSNKMAEVATRIAKENGFLSCESNIEGKSGCRGVMKVVHGMVEDLVSSEEIKPQSVDVLLSEWMGYCLLYESMLSSVLTARDQWLKPGGAILPDTATMFVAGFGKGATSIPFWEDVYGFNMSSVGKELVKDAAKSPIVDVVDAQDILTSSVILQTFDLVTMKSEDMDFTATVELEPKSDVSGNHTASQDRIAWCYGVVLWFDNGFTSRFCHENPTVLSTSPYTPKTHWSQTIFTFHEPIALSSVNSNAEVSSAVGTQASPAMKLRLRISIARALEHRSIDIAIETTATGSDDRKRSYPVQIFNLC